MTRDTVTPNLKNIIRKLEALPVAAYDYWLSKTPIRTGNAREQTRLENGHVIAARYSYAERLDAGYSSQSRDGMSKPTAKFIQDYVNRLGK